MSIRKRYREDGSYTWEFCITISKHPRKQYRKSGYAKKELAMISEQEAIARLVNGTNFAREKTTFSELCKQYLKYCETKSKSIQRNYNNSYKNHLQFFYDYKLKDISSMLVENWVRDCKKTPNTIAECIKFCKAVFNYGIKHDIVYKNPFLRVEKPKVKPKERNRLTAEEAIKMLQVCKDIYPDFYPILATQIFTGVRQGELLALKWKDFNFKEGKVKIQRQYTQGELKENLKTSSSYREIDICPTLVKILQEHRREQARITEFVFTNSAGNLYNPRNLVQRRFEKLLEKLYGDKKYMRFYDLRGTYVDILLAENIPLKYIQKQVGHSNFLTTMNAYSKLIRDVNDHAVDVLEKVVNIL